MVTVLRVTTNSVYWIKRWQLRSPLIKILQELLLIVVWILKPIASLSQWINISILMLKQGIVLTSGFYTAMVVN